MRRMKNTKKLTSFLFLTAIVLLVAGFSFAYFNFSKVQTDYSLIVGGGTVNLNFNYSTDYHIPDMPCTEREAMKYTPISFNVKGINDKGDSIFYEISFDDLISAADETLFGDTDIIQFSLKKNGDFIYREKSYNDFDGEIIDIGSVTPKSGMSVNDKYELWLWIRDDVLVSDSPKYTQGFYKVFDTLSFDKKVALTGISINAYEGLGVTLKTNFDESTTQEILVEAPNLYTNGRYIQLTSSVPLIGIKEERTVGYFFCGWSESKDGPVKYYPGDIITENKVLYAQYSNKTAYVRAFENMNAGSYSETGFYSKNWPASGYFDSSIRPNVKEIIFGYTTMAFGRQGVVNGYYNYYLVSKGITNLIVTPQDPIFGLDDVYVRWDSTSKILRLDSPSSINISYSDGETSIFSNCPNLYTVTLYNGNFRMNQGSQMFYSSPNIRKLDLSGAYFNCRNVKTFYNSFRSCSNLEELILPKLIDNPDGYYDAFCCFALSSKLKKVNWESFNHQYFSRTLQFFYGTNIQECDMSYMNFTDGAILKQSFYNAKLKQIHVQGPDYSKVTDMYGFLQYCPIEYIDMSGIDISNCTDISYLLSNCTSLRFARLDNLKMGNVKTVYNMFSYSTSLTTVYMNNTDFTNVYTATAMFYSCTNLRIAEWSGKQSKVSYEANSMYRNCYELLICDVSMLNGGMLKNATSCFSNMRKCKAILSNSNWYNLADCRTPFTNDYVLTGGNGTQYTVAHYTDTAYCKIDDDVHPGYFTLKDSDVVYNPAFTPSM